MTALSLHVGLNRVDPRKYAGWDGALAACEYDAKDMKAIAIKKGFTPTTLLTASATHKYTVAAITTAAKALKAGDYFFLSYSGHGGQVPDRTADEPDRRDETWVLYDRQLLDDEIYSLLSQFQAGVRITVLSDSCHSGTVLKNNAAFMRMQCDMPAYKAMPTAIQNEVYKANKLMIGIARLAARKAMKPMAASAVLISGCQDNQFSSDGERNGLFTEQLRAVWNNGKYTGSLVKFHKDIVAQMPADQTPGLFRIGPRDLAFEAAKPFSTIKGKTRK